MLDKEQVNNNEVNIDLGQIISIFYRYKYAIILITLIAAFSSYFFAYFKTNIYEAETTVEVGRGSITGSSGQGDVLSSLSDSMSLDTEFDIIKSRLVTNKALKEVDWRHHYYIKTRIKEWELYAASPIRVELQEGIGINFFLYPSSDPESFRLHAEGSDKKGKWEYDKMHQYGAAIKNTHFELTVHRVEENPIEDGKYRFFVLTPLNATIAALRGVSVEHGSGYSNVFTIKNQDTVPLRAKEFLNALARAYMVQNIEKKTREASKMLTFIDEQLGEVNKNLQESANNLESFKKNTNTAEISTKTQLIITKMSEYESKLVDISIEEKMYDAVLKQIEGGEKLETLSIAGLRDSGTSLVQLVQELQQTVLKRDTLLLDYTKANREIAKLNKMISQINRGIIDILKNLKQSVKERKKLIQLAMGVYEKRLKELPANEKIYSRLERSYKVNQEIYAYLLKKRSEIAIIKASTVSKNRIIDPALPPRSVFKPNRPKIIVFGTLLGLLLGILYAFIREFLDDTIKNEEDVRRRISIPILGQIPHIEKITETEVAVLGSPKSAAIEAFRTLRSNLQYMSATGKSEVIVLTSTVGSEGKTTIAANLAAIMSLTGKRTIVLNLDLRKPTLAKKFNLSNNRGMSSLLSGRATLEEVVQKTSQENLFLISSGPIPPNPTELIESTAFKSLLEELKQDYDVVILDTPPVGVISDAISLMHLADTTIYVLRANYSKRVFLTNIQRLKDENDIPGLGILMNDVGYGLAYGYGYGSYGYGSYGYYSSEKS